MSDRYAFAMGWKGLFVGILLVGILASPAAAQISMPPGDFCFETDHSGDNEFGSPSAARLYLTLSPEYAGTWLDLSVTGASGDVFGAGMIESDGIVMVNIPLFQFGPHEIKEGIVDSVGANHALDVTGLSFEIDSNEPTCNLSEMAKVAVGVTTTTAQPTTTTTTSTTTTVASAAPTSPTISSSTTTTSVAEPGSTSGGSGGWVVPFGGGLILIIGGAILWRRPDDPCQEELKAWNAAQAACDGAQATADAAKAKCDEAETKVTDLEQQRKDMCKEWPPACWDDEDGGWIEESGRPETRITQRDLHLRREALGDVWDAYKDGELSAEQVEDAWKRADTPEFREQMRERDARATAELSDIDNKLGDAKTKSKELCDKADTAKKAADEACAKAAAAKQAYFDCMDAAAPDPAPDPDPTPPTQPTGPTGPTAPGTTGGGGTPPTTPPATDPPSGASEEEEEVVCCEDGMWIGYGWTTGGILFLGGYESSILNFVCLSCGDRFVTMSSRSFRVGLGLGGETALFGAFMWGVPHATNVPDVWREKAASGFDFDLSFGPSVSKGLKNVIKSAGMKKAGDYLRWAAKQKVPPSALDPRKLETLKKVGRDVAENVPTGVGRGLQSQGAHPQVLVVPLGAGLQAGGWWKVFATTATTDFRSCGCPWPQ